MMEGKSWQQEPKGAGQAVCADRKQRRMLVFSLLFRASACGMALPTLRVSLPSSPNLSGDTIPTPQEVCLPGESESMHVVKEDQPL